MRVEADGLLVGWRTNHFRDGDAIGATLESASFDAGGRPTGEPRTERVTWAELQAHAWFPAATTTRESITIESPLGRLDCLHYRQTEDDGSTSDFWFARSMPGMPIRYRSVVDGRVTSETLVVENVLPARPANVMGRSKASEPKSR